MKVIIYVDWNENCIYSKKEAEEAVERLADYGDEAFSEWLDENYFSAEIYHMTGKMKEKVWADFEEAARSRAWEDFEYSCEKKEIEV